MSMDLNDVAVFVKVVQAGSFSQAARLLDAPKSTVSAKVAALERRLGVTLLQRTTRSLHVTPDGERFFRSCVTALDQLDAAETAITSAQKAPHGRIVVTAPMDLGVRFMPTFLARFFVKYPKVEVSLLLSNRFVDLIAEGVDVAIRAGELKDSSLVAKRLGTTNRSLFASPAYLERHGEPKQPQDLAKFDCVRFGATASADDWKLMNGRKTVIVKTRGRVAVDDLTAARQMAVHGHGIVLMPTMFCHEDVNQSRLVPVLAGWYTEAHPLALVYPAQRFQHARVRAFIDEISAPLTELTQEGDSRARRQHP